MCNFAKRLQRSHSLRNILTFTRKWMQEIVISASNERLSRNGCSFFCYLHLLKKNPSHGCKFSQDVTEDPFFPIEKHRGLRGLLRNPPSCTAPFRLLRPSPAPPSTGSFRDGDALSGSSPLYYDIKIDGYTQWCTVYFGGA